MCRRPPRSTRTDTLFPDTTLVRSCLTPRSGVDVLANGVQQFFTGERLGQVLLGPDDAAAGLVEQAVLGGQHDDGRSLEKLVVLRSEEHTSELQSLMRISYAVFCLTKKQRTHHEQSIPTKKRT